MDIDTALTAFRAGNFRDAFTQLSDLREAGPLPDHALLAFAQAAGALEKYEVCLEAVDHLLEKNPTSAEATLIKADAFKALGKPRFAAGFYRAFLSLAQMMNDVPAHLQPAIARAQQECQNAAADYQQFLHENVAGAGFNVNGGPTRLGQAIDIMFGRKTIYAQSPSKFYFPELPQIQYYDYRQFDWTAEIIEQAETIKDELAALIASQADFDPYVQHNINAPKMSQMGRQLMGRTDWSAYHLYKDGAEQPDHMARCPRTLEILKAAPIPKIRTVSPSILYSQLTAGSHIPPHSGVCNTRLICHLPLIVPQGCWLRVGNQTREWRDGEMLIFDDSIEHEAKNPTGETRIILLFDIWRPELNEDERRLVETVFNAVDAYNDVGT